MIWWPAHMLHMALASALLASREHKPLSGSLSSAPPTTPPTRMLN
jgi:hypothetical protein